MNKFSIPIPNDREKSYRLFTFIIITLNFLGFGYIFLLSQTNISSAIALMALVINGVPWIYYLLNKKHLKFPATELTGLLSGIIWFYFGMYMLGIMLILFTLFGYFANKEKVIIFSDEGILYPSFPEKNYLWNEVVQVVCKDDILSIDLKNNQLMQFKIGKEFSEKFDAHRFNEFCKQNVIVD